MTIHYEDATVVVHHGDCLDVLRGLPDASVDCVVTDPPYALPGGFMNKGWDAYDGREDAAFAYWLAGLIDGEGHFAIKAHSRGTHAPMFQLSMRLDERGTLEQIKRHLAVGTITVVKHEPNDVVRWIVQDKAGCQRLVDLLDKYPLRAKKRMDYAVWREAVCEWTDRPRGNRWHGGADNSRMAQLRERIMTGRAYVDPPWSGHEFQDWCRLWAVECLRVLRPGGHLLAFGGTRTSHRLTCGLEDAGFEIRDVIGSGSGQLAWVTGQGFPKSLNVSKAIDQQDARVQRFERIAHTPEAQQWEGWGTALRPSWEPIVVARKPLAAGTVAANVLRYGTGALNIDACRIGTNGGTRDPGHAPGGPTVSAYGNGLNGRAIEPVAGLGRWPANVVLDGRAAAALDTQSGDRHAGGHVNVGENRDGSVEIGPVGLRRGRTIPGDNSYTDSGGASRFFLVAADDPLPIDTLGDRFRYVAKAGADERPRVPKAGAGEGRVTGLGGKVRECNECGSRAINSGATELTCGHHDHAWVDNPRAEHISHPTVKPLDLMRWLVRLVTPPGGTCLDPFAGSGTTVEACVLEGFRCVAIEREAEYLPLIEARITRQRDPVRHIELTGGDLGLFDLGETT